MPSDESDSSSNDGDGDAALISLNVEEHNPYHQMNISDLAADFGATLEAYKTARQAAIGSMAIPGLSTNLAESRSALLEATQAIQLLDDVRWHSLQPTIATVQEVMEGPAKANAIAQSVQIDPASLVNVDDILQNLQTPLLSVELGQLATDYQEMQAASGPALVSDLDSAPDAGTPNAQEQTTRTLYVDYETAQRVLVNDLGVENGVMAATVAIFLVMWTADISTGVPLGELPVAFVLAKLFRAGFNSTRTLVSE